MPKILLSIFFLFVGCRLSAQTPSWAFNLACSGTYTGKDCKVCPNGNVCIAGRFDGTMDLDPGPGVYNITSNGLDDIYLACYTSTGAFLWGFGIGGPSYDAAFKMTIDANNNVIICGYFQSAGIDFDPGAGTTILPYTGGTGLSYYGDGFVAKYSSTGVFQWAKDLGGTTVYDHTESLGTDAAGNVYVGGEFDVSMTVGSLTFSSGTSGQSYLLKYNAAGTLIWGHNFGYPGTTSSDSCPFSLQVSNGYIYVAGFYQATSNFDPWGTPALLTSVGTYDNFIAKYDTNGNYVFAYSVSGNGNLDQLFGLVLDANDNMYVTGITNGTSVTFSPTLPSTVACPGGGGNNDIIIAKYDKNGVYQWGTVLGSTGDDDGWAIDLSNGYIYCTGWFHGTVDMDPSAAVSNLVSSGSADAYVTKYDLNGNYVCGFRLGSATTDDEGYGVSHDASGNIYVSGEFGGTAVDFDPGTGTYPLTAATTLDAFLVKYNYIAAATFTGNLVGDTICPGHPGYLTVNVASGGAGPYTVTYSNGTTSQSVSGVSSGLPFSVTPAPVSTTTYTIVSITNAASGVCTQSSGAGFGSAAIVMSTNCGCDSLSIPSPLNLCIHDTATLHPVLTGNNTILGIAWTPGTGLSSTTILNPLLTATTSGWYDLTVQTIIPTNLVVNGDFSAGNTGFTSTYTYSPPPSTTLIEGDYSVYTNPYGVHTGFLNMGDHTTGTGNMMIINGGGTPSSVWCETIPVTPNTTYDFSAWFADCSAVTVGADVPILQFMVNGILLGAPTSVTAAPGTWVNFFSTWNSGANTSATICIYDEVTVTSGNDFVIDDISFQQVCTVKDSVYLNVVSIDTTYTHHDTSACAPITAVTLTAPTGYSSYTWSTGVTTTAITVSSIGAYWVYAPSTCAMLVDTFHLSVAPVDTTYAHVDSSACASAGSINLTAPAGYTSYTWSTGGTGITISVTTAGIYWVYAPAACAMLIDTFHVAFNPLPVVNLGNDTDFCAGNSVVLTSVQPAGNTYQWSTGSTADSIHVSATGTYWLHVHNGCDATDTVNITVNPAPVVDLGPDTTNCQGTPVVLQSSVTYPTGYTYVWSTTATTPSITVTATGTYWLQVNSNAGCSGADTVKVTILYDTVTLHTGDTAICKGQSVQVITTGNPTFNTYQWIPTTGIATSNVGSPVIFGDTSAMYIMTAHYPGCPDIIDSFYLDVQPNPIHVYIGGNRTVCQYDTLHILSSVTPGWYSHYSYTWTPSTSLDNSTLSSVIFTAGTGTELTLSVTTSAGCNGVDSAKITVYPGDFAHVDSVFNICPHDSVQFMPTGGVSYSWYPSMYIDSPTSSAPWVHAITSQHYTMVATSQYGCKDTLGLYVSVRPAASIYLPDSVTIYPGGSYQLDPQTNCTEFIWTPSIGLSYTHISNPLATPAVNTKYIVYGTTEWGCKAEDSIMIYVDQQTILAMPNAFSPGSGPNGVFKIIKLGIATLNYFRVYNRWGNVVYDGSNIDEGWDGTYKGVPQPFDVYVYDIEAVTNTGEIFHKSGNVTLIR